MAYTRNIYFVAALVAVCIEMSMSQQSFNFAKKAAGERDGDLTPSQIAGVSLGVIAGVCGLVVTVFFCYYVHRQQKQQSSLNSSFAPTAHI